MSCCDIENEYICLFDRTISRIVHGLGCPMWRPRMVENPFVQIAAEDPDYDSKFPQKKHKGREPFPPGVDVVQLPDGCESVYELTLTTTKDDVYELRDALKKVAASAMFEVIKYEACIELQANGMPHVHAIIYSKKKFLDATKIKGKPVNFPYRYQLKKVRKLANYLNYIKKEDGNVDIKAYCEAKGVDQFWTNGV